MKRLLLLHGYTESSATFAPLRPLLPPGLPVVAMELAEALADWRPLGPVNVASAARRLAAYYRVTAHDVVLGHSMGGWLAAYLKQETGCTAVLLSGFTHQNRIISRLRGLGVLRLVVQAGLLQSRWLNARFKRRYPFAESRALYGQLLDDTRRLSRAYLYQQLQILFAPAPPLTARPDLRLHARHDHIILPPTEFYVEIAGDHFGHYFYPQQVLAAIRPLLG
ncbi:alpha/beta hydrolase [Hymenobacter sp. RP-2-7]|uniref:Alpha/beta hydrolase n=1 Tax=Hymenobacter polaris TaxID=2682546 RepID=A0A7Y0ABE1_9BACT|nr:alpha/beta hydrolase [Hymenobacter polaris]NML64269.1 alpha/beta hydrolase [Hymenobacter polaris]